MIYITVSECLQIVVAVFAAMKFLMDSQHMNEEVKKATEFLIFHQAKRTAHHLELIEFLELSTVFSNGTYDKQWYDLIKEQVTKIIAMLKIVEPSTAIENVMKSVKLSNVLERYSKTVVLWTAVMPAACKLKEQTATTAMNENIHGKIRNQIFNQEKNILIPAFIEKMSTIVKGMLIPDDHVQYDTEEDFEEFIETICESETERCKQLVMSKFYDDGSTNTSAFETFTKKSYIVDTHASLTFNNFQPNVNSTSIEEETQGYTHETSQFDCNFGKIFI